jgi:hypothetical protein
MKFILLSALFLVCFSIGNAQTTYTIDFAYKSLGTSCNVFSVDKNVDNYIHQTTIGFPNFVGNPDYYANLPCKRNSSTSQVGTEYQILFPFKKGYKYTINAYCRGTISNNTEFYPMLAIGLNATKKAQNTSTNCSGPKPISMSGYTYSSTGSRFAWAASPIITTGELTQDYQSLSVASTPWPSSGATGIQTVQVRKIQITEEIVAIPPPPPPTSGFEAKFYKNVNNGNRYIGIKGKYRVFSSDNDLNGCFDYPNNITFIKVSSDPVSTIIGDPLATSQGWLYNGELTELSTLFIIDEWNNKKYFVEAKRNTYPIDVQTIELHCTDISDPVKFSLYKFRIDDSHANVWRFNSTNGYKVEFDGLIHNAGGGAGMYFIKSPDLP